MRYPTTPVRRRLIAVVAGLALTAAACAADDSNGAGGTAVTSDPASSESASSGPPASPAPGDTSEPGDTSATADPAGVPARIVSLSPTHTEILFAIGAGDQLVAVDDFSNHPPEALELPNELSGYEPNVEAIAGYEPDLVVIGGDFTGLGDQLGSIGIETWDGPAATTLDDTYAQIEQLGAITGHVDDAAELVSLMQTEIESIVASLPTAAEPLTYYHEVSADLYSADSSTFIGEIYGLLGLRSIADQVEGDHGGYPQLNAEFILSTDPDLIFLADTVCCGESVATVAARPGWESMSAVVNGNVSEMNDDLASRWGPRIVEYLADVATAVERALVPA